LRRGSRKNRPSQTSQNNAYATHSVPGALSHRFFVTIRAGERASSRIRVLRRGPRLPQRLEFSADGVQLWGRDVRIEFEVPHDAVGLVRVKVEDSHVTLSRLAANLWQQIETLQLW